MGARQLLANTSRGCARPWVIVVHLYLQRLNAFDQACLDQVGEQLVFGAFGVDAEKIDAVQIGTFEKLAGRSDPCQAPVAVAGHGRRFVALDDDPRGPGRRAEAARVNSYAGIGGKTPFQSIRKLLNWLEDMEMAAVAVNRGRCPIA